jgi:hypothetical protein
MPTLYQLETFNVSEKLTLLTNYLKTEALTQPLHTVEQTIFQKLLEMGNTLMSEYIAQKSHNSMMPSVVENNEIIPFHSMKKREYLSIFGKVAIMRPYFWKRGSPGLTPLDAELNLPRHCHSYLLDKWVQHRVAEGPYEEAINNIYELLGLKVNKDLVQKITQEASQDVYNYYKQKEDFLDEGSHLVLQVDCKGVVMIPKERPKSKLEDKNFVRRAKGVSKIGTRKDAVVTLSYSINPLPRTPHDVLEGLMGINSNKNKEKKKYKNKLAEPINKQVAATMFGKEKAFETLFDHVQARDKSFNKPIFLLMDGASSLEKGFMSELKKREWEKRVVGYCLDIVHVTEYLWDASTAIYGETNPERVLWVRTALEKTLSSNIESVIEELEKKIKNKKTTDFVKKRLQRSVSYFNNHKHMMDYSTYLKKGLPIASGAIEGACNSVVKDRTDRSGMQWTKKGADAVVNLRTVQCNNDWENYWNYHIQTESEQLYGNYAA